MCLTVGNPSDPCCESVKPEPSSGAIWRYFRPQAIADYAALSDATWSTGTTGHPGLTDDHNCYYHHFQSSSRLVGVFNILNPIRWSPLAPAEDGGRFDCWEATSADQYRANPFSNGFFGLRRGLIPRDWHCRFIGNIAQPYSPPLPEFCTRATPGDDNVYQEANLQAIAPAVLPFYPASTDKTFPIEITVAAVNHLINGQSVRGVVVGDALDDPRNWLVRVRPEDIYEIDVWYRIGNQGFPSGPATPAKGCAILKTSRVHNGSERVHNMHAMQFLNVDFSPAFNPEKQTYEITLAGHRGWSFAFGSNGPHKMLNAIPGEPVELSIAVGSTSLICNVVDESKPIESLRIYWFFEIAFAVITFRLELGLPAHAALYRSTDTGGHYLTTTQSTDFGTIRHSPPGRFNQGGTTVFELVPWSLNPTINEAFEDYGKESEGTTGPDPAIPSNVPRIIIVTRVNQ